MEIVLLTISEEFVMIRQSIMRVKISTQDRRGGSVDRDLNLDHWCQCRKVRHGLGLTSTCNNGYEIMVLEQPGKYNIVTVAGRSRMVSQMLEFPGELQVP